LALAAGTPLGPYEIVAPIGAGGMGEVYRARDQRLKRDVAIKVLPEDSLGSEEARARFRREAESVAALSHPNILAIHDVGEHDGMAYVVTELLEGQSLHQMIRGGAVPLRLAIDLAAQTADGLAAAHDKGIVHRDIKPANLFVTSDGRLKILDFGLAKALAPPNDANAETRTLHLDAAPGTSPGVVLGTTRYMSPEQVRAEETDHRSDIFSFGAALLEVLTGKPAFEGDTAVEVMSAILNQDPYSNSLTGTQIPAPLDRIVHRCLEKVPERRFQSARDLAFALRNASDTSGTSVPGIEAVTEHRSGSRRWARMLPVLLVGIILGAALARFTAKTPVPEPVRVKSMTHSGRDWNPSVSPDGSMIAFVSDRDGRERIWLRQLAGGTEAPLTEGTDNGPRFAPDGASVLFFRAAIDQIGIYRVPVLGGTPRKIADGYYDADFSPDGKQLVCASLWEEGGQGGVAVNILDIQSNQSRELARLMGRALYGLRWSPSGQWIAGSSTGASQNVTDNSIVLIDTRSGELITTEARPRRLSAPSWSTDGRRLIVAESTSLLGDLSGALGRVLDLDPFTGDEHTLFWVQSVWGGNHQYVTIDTIDEDSIVFDEILWRGHLMEISPGPDGVAEAELSLTQGNGRDRQPAYSPDGRRIVFSSNRSGNLDVWIMDIESGELRQVTDDDADDWDPAFSADGEELIWSSNRGGHLEIWMANIDGSSARQVSQDGEDAENPTQTADGEWIVYGSANPAHVGIWKVRPRDGEAVRLTEGAHILPEVSPDGSFAAYFDTRGQLAQGRLRVVDLESGEEVFSTDIDFGVIHAQIQVGRSRWMPDGSAIVFVDTDDRGQYGLYIQDFQPGTNTRASRRPLLLLDDNRDVESFAISPDGSRTTISSFDHFRSVKVARGIAGFR
jgi:Tol biopolymer transport system component